MILNLSNMNPLSFKTINPYFEAYPIPDRDIKKFQKLTIHESTDENIFLYRCYHMFLKGLENRAPGTHTSGEIESGYRWTSKTKMTDRQKIDEIQLWKRKKMEAHAKKNQPTGFTFKKPNSYSWKNGEYTPAVVDLEYQYTTECAELFNLPTISECQLTDFHQYLLVNFQCFVVYPGKPGSVIEQIIYIKECILTDDTKLFGIYIKLTLPQYKEIIMTATAEFGKWPANLNVYYTVTKFTNKIRINSPLDNDQRRVICNQIKPVTLLGNYCIYNNAGECKLYKHDIVSYWLIPGFIGFIPMLPTIEAVSIQNKPYVEYSHIFPTCVLGNFDKIITLLPPKHGELTSQYILRLMEYDTEYPYGREIAIVKKCYPSIKIISSGMYERYEYANQPETLWDEEYQASQRIKIMYG